MLCVMLHTIIPKGGKTLQYHYCYFKHWSRHIRKPGINIGNTTSDQHELYKVTRNL